MFALSVAPLKIPWIVSWPIVFWPKPVSPDMPPSNMGFLNMASSQSVLLDCACFYGHRGRGARAGKRKEKRPRGTRPSGTFSTPEVSLERLIRRVGRLGSWRLRRSSGSSRLRSGLCRGRGWRHGGLRVVGVHNGLGDVDLRDVDPQYRALRPGLGSIHDHAEGVVLRVFHEHGSHFLQDALGNLVLLVAEVLLVVLARALQRFLFAFDLLAQGFQRLWTELVALGGQLLLQGFEFVVLAGELGALGLELLGKILKIAVAFVGKDDRLFDVDRPDLGARAGSHGRRGCGRGCAHGGGGAGLGDCRNYEKSRN